MGSSNLSVLSSVATRASVRHVKTSDVEGFSGRVMDWVRQMFCGLQGHDNMLQFEHEHMYLRCTSCGNQTPGWRLDDLQPVRRLRNDGSSRTLVRPQLDSVRRVA
jgi:hypothetical protein